MYLDQVNSNKLTSNVGNKKRELPEKWFLRPLAKFPIAWIASTETAMFTSVISYNHKDVLCKYSLLEKSTVSNKSTSNRNYEIKWKKCQTKDCGVRLGKPWKIKHNAMHT